MSARFRAGGWRRRVSFPDTLDAPLGFGTEYWRDREELPGYDILVSDPRWKRLPIDPWFELTQHLLDEVIDAAAAIEYTVARIEVAAGEIEAWVASDEFEFKPDPELGAFLGHPSVWPLYIETQTLLMWVRALSDRLSRSWQGRDWGLVPSLRPGTALHETAERLVADYRLIAGEARVLANLTMHTANLPQQVVLGPAGIQAKYPDPPSGPIEIRNQLTYSTQRDAVKVAQHLRAAAATLVDGLLDAFEAGAPERFRRAPDSAMVPG